jgi:membrane-associated phospholipid phosphatase
MKHLFFFILFSLINSYAQVDSLFVSDLNDFLNTSANFYTSPLRFESEDWTKLTITLAAVGLSTLADKQTRDFAQRNKSNLTDNVFLVDKYYSVEFAGVSILALYGYGLIDENRDVRNLAVKLTEATFLAGSITLVTKVLVGRRRPYKQESNYYTDPLTLNNDYNSFPSGHTTLAFAYSTVMANEIDNIFWKIGWYSAAGLVGYARIYHNQHWLSDVVMSAAIGYFSGEFVNGHMTNNKNTSLSFYPLPNGFALQLRF